jgi:hypothetical protein
MSHHLDSPESRSDPRLNVTDNYVFDSPNGTVFAMIVNTSLAGATPGFHPEARYEFKIHLDDAARENLCFRVTFGDRDADGRQSLMVHRLDGADAADDSASGAWVLEGRTEESVKGSGIRAWAGLAADPFYLDLRELAFIVNGIQSETPISIEGWGVADGANSFAGSSVWAIVIEVPYDDPQLNERRAIGAWSVTKLATDSGGWHQTNRSGIPMVWPLLRAIGNDDASEEYHRDTHAEPADDLANDGARFTAMIAAAARNTGTRNAEAYAATVVARLLPDLLPFVVGTPASFGFAGFNGRALHDNAPEVMFSLITNTGFPTGLTAASAAETHGENFPYVQPV